jgi:hypothetical protein
MRKLLFLSLGSLSLLLLGCGDIAVQKPGPKQQGTAKQKTVANKKVGNSTESTSPQAFEKWRNSLRDADERRYLQVSGEIGRKATMFTEGSERLRDIVNEMFSDQGTAKGSAVSAITFFGKGNSGPETYAQRLEICRVRLHNLRKNLDDAKRECPDTPAVLGLYRASRELIDGIERLIDERYVPLSAQIYDEKLTAEEKLAAAEQVRRACYQEAAAWQRAREDARQAYRRDRIDQMNQIIWKKTLNPKYQPTITTIPPPAATKKS